ncbi:YPO3983 family protein [Enterobacter sp.]|uniref:YPO3983 family protein n=1 Tax=Enterobacter sp. TaxID=42895 RepID=UPI00296FE60D|nr:YPO3983 family protein [Enterobacter sp.]
MNNSYFLSRQLPCVLFTTVRRFDDFSAEDMQYGDMDEQQLLELGLKDISLKVDPYRLVRYDFPRLAGFPVEFYPNPKGRKITRGECIDILFDEMKALSHDFSLFGEYKDIINQLIDHFRYGQGIPFYSTLLDSAYKHRVNGYDQGNPLMIIKLTLNERLGRNKKQQHDFSLLKEMQIKLNDSKLPKFNNVKDRFNGLGISVHDIAAQEITLVSLHQFHFGWEAVVHFKAQDHFGLDIKDIKNDFYRQFRFFRIWFFLQRHQDFAFRPFFTNFSTVVRINSY